MKITKRYIGASSNTRSYIDELETKIEILKQRLADPNEPEDERIDDHEELMYLEDELRNAWAEDEKEWDYARNAQEFNPDGSLALYSSTSVECSDDVEYDGKIHEGLVWDRNGHEYRVVELTVPGERCKVTERWLSEDSGKELEQTREWSIAEDPERFIDEEDNPIEFMYPAEQNSTIWNRFYATSALNFEEPYSDYETSDDYESEDDERYTPSATRGDYSPSSPWNAPGMSIHDFI